MKVAFRADASLQIGTGHVMRCLTLADALVAKGAVCEFICRAHEGNLIEYIQTKGYVVHSLPIAKVPITGPATSPTNLAHNQWLGVTQAIDAEACAPMLAALCPDWLIVDHYALDVRWERTLAPYYRKLMVIDDLADRFHACDVLLDQTFGRVAADYRALVSADCNLLCGSQYALLRPEFATMRPYSLKRRAGGAMRELLITMGGVDKGNATGQVLGALRECALPADCRISVVMGVTAPWLDEVRAQAHMMPWPTRVLVGVSDMAQLMADSDLAIGAAGATSWERCCLGVPTIMLVLAENQRKIAQVQAQAGAAYLADASTVHALSSIILKCSKSKALGAMCTVASAITDGLGVARVSDILIDKVQHAYQLAV